MAEVNIWKISTHHESRERAAELYDEENVIAIGFLFDQSIEGKSEDEIKSIAENQKQIYEDNAPDPNFAKNQLMKFRDAIKVGDIVLAYQGNNIVALVGEVTGEYEFNNMNNVAKELEYFNQRRVNWWGKPRNFDRRSLPEDYIEKVQHQHTIIKLDTNVDSTKIKEEFKKIPSSEEVEPIIEVTKEEEVKKYLERRINDLEVGLKHKRTEYEVDVGSIDILAEDRNGTPVIIETKVEANDSAVGQILGYIQSYKESTGVKGVRGIIIAQNMSERCKKAAEYAGIETYAYEKTFRFKQL